MVPAELRRLARLYGVQTAYYDVNERRKEASSQSLLRALKALGVPIDRPEDAADLVRSRREELGRRTIEPVTVAWQGAARIALRLSESESRGPFVCRIEFEGGRGEQQWNGDLAQLATTSSSHSKDVRYVVKQLVVPLPLPTGYHRLILEHSGRRCETLVISSPRLAYGRAVPVEGRAWGVFCPLYALRRKTSWGGGDFDDLEAMIRWVSDQGGRLVATLPLLSWLSEVSDDPSPYSPASRLFWNEFYLDLTRTPEFQENRDAQELVASERLQRELQELRESRFVDYHRQAALKREVLQLLAGRLSPARLRELEEYRAHDPEVEEYARFRAVCERRQSVWLHWPQRQRDGELRDGDWDEETFRRHLYAQWQVEQQLQHLAREAGEREMLWYLDYPLGVSNAGYDVWRHRELFGLDADGGAPPDAFFTKGQNWGFPPLHPERIREEGYRYVIRSIQRHLKFAKLLRIDHVMGLHRLYWIPRGLDAHEGVYVRYRSEELFAILIVESHRYQAQIVGENLGTVPRAINAAMERHAVNGMYVVQYESRPDQSPPLRSVPPTSVASINTHDMPMFASFWQGLDIDDRVDLGLMDAQEAADERRNRAALRRSLWTFLNRAASPNGAPEGETLIGAGAEAEADPVPDSVAETDEALAALLQWLADSPAEVVLVNLEDLWGETSPQNTPGTFRERINWQRKCRYTLEEIQQLPEVRKLLELVAQRRRISGKNA